MSNLSNKASLLVAILIFCYIFSAKADLNSGTDDGDDSLDSSAGSQPMEHKDEILNSMPKMPTTTPNPANGKLQIGIKKKVENCERKATKGDTLHMHYKGSLKDTGAEFDSSYKRGQPLIFRLGQGNVIKGWDQGLLGICAGEKRKLVIPPHLAYGEMGSPPTIPGGATLVFEVEAVKVEPPVKLEL